MAKKKRRKNNNPSEVYDLARKHGVLAFDVEASSKDARTAEPLFYSIAAGRGRSIKSAIVYPTKETHDLLRLITQDSRMRIVAHNKSYDLKFLHRFVMPIRLIKAKVVDTMNLSWLHNNLGNRKANRPHSLDAVASKYLGAGKFMGIKEIFVEGETAKEIEALVTKGKEIRKKWKSLVRKLNAHRRKKIRQSYAFCRDQIDLRTDLTGKEKREQKKQIKDELDASFEDAGDKVLRAANRRLADLKSQVKRLEAKQQDLFRVYALKDAELALRLYWKFKKLLLDSGKLAWAEVERVVGDVATDMESTGFPFSNKRIKLIDKKYIQPKIEELETEIMEIGRAIMLKVGVVSEREAPNWSFKTNDGKMLSTLLFTTGEATCTRKGGLSETVRSKKEREKNPKACAWYKTDRTTLTYTVRANNPEEKHPLSQKILEIRALEKLRDAFINRFSKVHGRMYCLFRPFGTDTGRWSSRNPNLQQIPSRHKIGKKIRSAFVAADDYVLIVADYSQVELRGIAHVCNEPNMIAEYQKFTIAEDGEKDFTAADLHQKTLEKLIELCPPELHQRVYAKICNFGLPYGIGVEKFAEQFQLEVAVATMLNQTYFKSYSMVKVTTELFDSMWRAGKRVWEIPLTGRTRRWPKMEMRNGELQETYMQAGGLLNTKVQGLCADILKAMLYQYYSKVVKHPKFLNNLDPLAQVHDEVIFQVRRDLALEAAMLLKWCMEYPWIKLKVPILADVHIVDNWAEGKDGTKTLVHKVTKEKKEVKVYPEWNSQLKRRTKVINEVAAEYWPNPRPMFVEDADILMSVN